MVGNFSSFFDGGEIFIKVMLGKFLKKFSQTLAANLCCVIFGREIMLRNFLSSTSRRNYGCVNVTLR